MRRLGALLVVPLSWTMVGASEQPDVCAPSLAEPFVGRRTLTFPAGSAQLDATAWSVIDREAAIGGMSSAIEVYAGRASNEPPGLAGRRALVVADALVSRGWQLVRLVLWANENPARGFPPTDEGQVTFWVDGGPGNLIYSSDSLRHAKSLRTSMGAFVVFEVDGGFELVPAGGQLGDGAQIVEVLERLVLVRLEDGEVLRVEVEPLLSWSWEAVDYE